MTITVTQWQWQNGEYENDPKNYHHHDNGQNLDNDDGDDDDDDYYDDDDNDDDISISDLFGLPGETSTCLGGMKFAFPLKSLNHPCETNSETDPELTPK